MSERDEFLRTEGARIRYRAAGRGPAVVFVHGWALDLDMWRPQFALLQARFHVVAFDRRGFGLSQGEPDMARDVDDLHALLDFLSAPEAAIVGMSQGARIALAFASALPVRVSCLVLDGPPRLDVSAAVPTSAEVPIARYRTMAARGELENVRKDWSRHPLMRLHSADPDTQALLREMVARYPGRDLRARETAATVDAPAPSAVRAPVLVVNGALDSVERRSAGATLARVFVGAKRAQVAGAGHMPNLDAPAAYCDLLTRFLDTHAHAPAASPASRADLRAGRGT